MKSPVISKAKHSEITHTLQTQKIALMEALRCCNLESERLTRQVEELLIENVMLEAENKRLLAQIELLRSEA